MASGRSQTHPACSGLRVCRRGHWMEGTPRGTRVDACRRQPDGSDLRPTVRSRLETQKQPGAVRAVGEACDSRAVRVC